jgi:hypothetical protein
MVEKGTEMSVIEYKSSEEHDFGVRSVILVSVGL